MSTSPLFWLRPLSICLTSQLYLWEYIWSSQQILTSLFGFFQIKAHLSKFNLVFRSHSVLKSLRKFGLALNLWKWQCSEGVVWFGFNELFLSLFPDNSWCPYKRYEFIGLTGLNKSTNCYHCNDYGMGCYWADTTDKTSPSRNAKNKYSEEWQAKDI